MENEDPDIENIFAEEPDPFERHPANLLQSIGDSIRFFRSSQPRDEKSRDALAKELSHYLGEPVHRQRIRRIEDGDTKVAAGVYFAVWARMGVLDKVALVTYAGSSTSMRYLHLLGDRLASETKTAMRDAAHALEMKAAREMAGDD
ncbi:hypothetical protein A3709_20575 [Halioglobus sp. HI00S01]|uniref:hypothetical protein n=1 Tax=Halioglobus sp. HI00S01 TaxID=1822214 RepID=UPI0007C3CEBF|nr:hypothetical protein [Halioglobus sp. HI00S01]KZX58009.1 hypothetical protein A3709_20575 [Halioglobus sp. HI00S01]